MERTVYKERQRSESFRVGALLAVSGGLLDAYTYLCRGGVFANAQTGNIVLVGIHAAKGDWGEALSAAAPITAFMVGILITEWIRRRFREGTAGALHWRHGMLALEIVLLLGAMLVPGGRWDHLVTVLISFVCALQVQTFRKIHGHAFATTMCTGNLRKGTEALCSYLETGGKEARHKMVCAYGIISFFVVGAVVGALLAQQSPRMPIPFALLMYLIAFGLMMQKRRGEGS